MAWVYSQFGKFSESPARWFFYVFIIASTLSIRKIFFFIPIGGFFNEYTSIFLYLSDILLIAALFSWLYPKLGNKKNKLSSIFTSSTSLLKNVPRGTLLPFLLVGYSLISVYWSVDQNIAIFRSLRLLGLFLFYLYVIKNVPRGTFIKRLVQTIIMTGLVHSIVGILQFVIQHSVGLHWLGESILSRDMIDVANIYLFGNKLVRSYGLFPHPNILGGFLIFSIALSLFYSKMFHHSQNVPRGTFDVAGAKLGKFILLVQVIALILTFSKTALIGMIISLLYVVKNNVPRGTLLRGLINLFHVEHFKMRKIVLAILMAVTLLVFAVNYQQNILQSIDERLWYLSYSIEMIYNNPIMGSGTGQFIPQLHALYGDAIEYWKYQPVHDVYLLVFSELGVVGLIMLMLFIYQLFRSGDNVPRGTLFSYITHRSKAKCSTWNNNTCKVFESGKKEEYFIEENMKIASVVFKSVLFGYLFIMLFDHYFWDIWQGQVIFWLVCGIIAGHTRLFKALTE